MIASPWGGTFQKAAVELFVVLESGLWEQKECVQCPCRELRRT